jgi:hypothetical protein
MFDKKALILGFLVGGRTQNNCFFVIDRHNKMKKESNQRSAADSLILLSNKAKTFCCVVCGGYVKTKRLVAYDLFEKIQQYKPNERELVRELRKHCQDHHPHTWIWNVIPVSGILSKHDREFYDKAADLDGILHQAMSTAAQNLTISPLQLSNPTGWLLLFCQRITYAQCWIKWSSEYYFTTHSPVDKPCKLRKLALERLSEMLSSMSKFLSTPQFLHRIGPTSFEFYINLFQLYFLERGRYIQCPYLGINAI